MTEHSALKFVGVLGLVVVGIFAAMAIFPSLFGILICGGFLVIAAIAGAIGNIPAIALTFGVVGVAFFFVVYLLVRYAKHRMKDETLSNTQESIMTQNARYIQGARAQGKNDAEIRAVFKNGGWSDDSINATFAHAGAKI